MRDHEAVFLEEPPDARFHAVLEGSLSIEDYVPTLDAEYSFFSRAMGLLLGELHGMGISIYRVEPYLEHLVAIHEFFSSGGSPEKLDPHHARYAVYVAERRATATLLNFHKTVRSSVLSKKPWKASSGLPGGS